MPYWTGEETVIPIIWANILTPGKMKWLCDDEGHVLHPETREFIGSYYESPTASGRGFYLCTKEYAGFVYFNEVEIIVIKTDD